ncbi:hypothetical protein ACLB1O_16790 [Escherichia coli]
MPELVCGTTEKEGKNRRTVCVIGDDAVPAGVAEAMDHGRYPS